MVFCHACGFQADSSVSNCTQCNEELISKDEIDAFREWKRKQNVDKKPAQIKSTETIPAQSSSNVVIDERKIVNEPQPTKPNVQNENTQRTRAVTVPQNGISKSQATSNSNTTDTNPNTNSTTPPLNKISSFSSFTPPKSGGKQCPGWKASLYLYDKCANCSQPKIRHEESKPTSTSKSFLNTSSSSSSNVSTPATTPAAAPKASAPASAPATTPAPKPAPSPSPPPSATPKPASGPSSAAPVATPSWKSSAPSSAAPKVSAATATPAFKASAPVPSPSPAIKTSTAPAKTSQIPIIVPKATAPPTTTSYRPAPTKPAPAVPPSALKPSTQAINPPKPPPTTGTSSEDQPLEFKIKTRRSTMMINNMLNLEQAQHGYSKPLPSVPCAKCKLPLPPTEDIVKFQNKLYHQQCFTCNICGCVFSKSNVYYEKKGLPYCEKDFFANQADGGVCHTCKKPIGEGQFIEVNGVPFHQDCFHCNGCLKVFDRKFCLWVGHQPFCDSCGRKAFVDFYTLRRQNMQPAENIDLSFTFS